MSENFRVEQTYDEIQQFVENAAYSTLGPLPEEMDQSGEEWAQEAAKRIAGAAVMHLDAAESDDDAYARGRADAVRDVVEALREDATLLNGTLDRFTRESLAHFIADRFGASVSQDTEEGGG